ncbi:hypothetical protein [Sphingomonas sp. 3-13AW]|uniref:hypothetical protein n=1 Tax=Sphingomonas sp. 3-13AW TaxID=3050450 RepID=UPI003BB68BDB
MDMSEPGLAEILGYNESTEFDEHGMRLWIEAGDERIDALRALETSTALALAQQAEAGNLSLLYYARVPQEDDLLLAA